MQTNEWVQLNSIGVISCLNALLEEIELFNGERLPPWEVEQLPGEEGTISDKLRQGFSEKGYETLEQIEALLGTDYGQRIIDKFYRHFVVQFKNGVKKMVRPSVDLSLIKKSEKFIEMADKIRAKRQANNGG